MKTIEKIIAQVLFVFENDKSRLNHLEIAVELSRFGFSLRELKKDHEQVLENILNLPTLNRDWGFIYISKLNEETSKSLKEILLDKEESLIQELILAILKTDINNRNGNSFIQINFPSDLFFSLYANKLKQHNEICIFSPESCLDIVWHLCKNNNVKYCLTLKSENLLPIFKYLFSSDLIKIEYQMHTPSVEFQNSSTLTIAFPVFGHSFSVSSNAFCSSLYANIPPKISFLDAVILNFLKSSKKDSELICLTTDLFLTSKGRGMFVKNIIKEKKYLIQEIQELPISALSNFTTIRSNFFSLKKTAANSDSSVKIKRLKLKDSSARNPNFKEIIVQEKEVQYSEFIESKLWTVKNHLAEKILINGPTKKLKNLLTDSFRGAPLSRSKEKTASDSAIIIQNKHVSGNIDTSKISATEFNPTRNINRYKLQNGDVLLTSRGTATHAGVVKKIKGTVLSSMNLVTLRTDPEQIDPDFLSEYLKSSAGEKELERIQSGSVINTLSISDLEDLDIPLPPLDAQKDIVKKLNQAHSDFQNTVESAELKYKTVISETMKDMGINN